MQKRPCGKTGLDFTAISFGGMRMHGDDTAPWAKHVRAVAEAGFNYFETSNRYCSSTSEIKIGEGLKGFPREKVYVSSKSNCRAYPTADVVRATIDESLERLQMDYLDFYQFWGLRWDDYNEIAVKKGGALEGVRKAMDEGLIRHLGFTCHDTPENMIKLLRTGEFESMTVIYNIIERENEPAIAEAGKLGVGVVVMGPLHGGLLGFESDVLKGLLGGDDIKTTAEASFRFVLSNPDVTCAISGMEGQREIADNVRIASNLKPLSLPEMQEVDKVLKKFKEVSDKLCTGCGYCMPCPQGVGIPATFKLANASRIYGIVEGSKRDYAMFDDEWPYDEYKDASHCVECGECLPKCPQGIDIPAELKKAHELLK